MTSYRKIVCFATALLNELEHEEFILKWKELEKKCNNLNYKIDDIFEIYSYT